MTFISVYNAPLSEKSLLGTLCDSSFAITKGLTMRR